MAKKASENGAHDVFATRKVERFVLDIASRHPEIHDFWDAESAWDEIFEALVPQVSLTLASMIARMTREWVSTSNPHFLDFACVLCDENSVPIPPKLSAAFATVAYQRLTGTSPGGTSSRVRRTLLLERAFQLIAHLRAVGLTLERAAIKTIPTLPAVPLIPETAARLARLYSESKWPSLELSVAENLRDTDEQTRWLQISEELPDADEEVWGTRR